jgi:RNA 2',3'-cyclic 3'-phosphodiesterase
VKPEKGVPPFKKGTRSKGDDSRSLRLFFALWPGDALRAALAAVAAAALDQVEGRLVPPGNLHVTLAFLGMTPGKALARLIEVGGQEGPWPAVELAFDRLDYWAKPKVVVAMAKSVPSAAQDIVDRLWHSLEPLGFRREARPWHPHLTLVRQVRRPPPENLRLPPVESVPDASDWRLALVESAAHPDGVRYKPLADWPLETSKGTLPFKGDVPL